MMDEVTIEGIHTELKEARRKIRKLRIYTLEAIAAVSGDSKREMLTLQHISKELKQYLATIDEII